MRLLAGVLLKTNFGPWYRYAVSIFGIWNTGPTGVIREREPRADGFRHIDTPAMIKRLQQLHATMYTYGVWDKATDWQDLTEEFAPAAEAAGIDIMVYIVPPSECFLNPCAARRPASVRGFRGPLSGPG